MSVMWSRGLVACAILLLVAVVVGKNQNEPVLLSFKSDDCSPNSLVSASPLLDANVAAHGSVDQCANSSAGVWQTWGCFPFVEQFEVRTYGMPACTVDSKSHLRQTAKCINSTSFGGYPSSFMYLCSDEEIPEKSTVDQPSRWAPFVNPEVKGRCARVDNCSAPAWATYYASSSCSSAYQLSSESLVPGQTIDGALVTKNTCYAEPNKKGKLQVLNNVMYTCDAGKFLIRRYIGDCLSTSPYEVETFYANTCFQVGDYKWVQYKC
jgi:hypothetical protein